MLITNKFNIDYYLDVEKVMQTLETNYKIDIQHIAIMSDKLNLNVMDKFLLLNLINNKYSDLKISSKTILSLIESKDNIKFLLGINLYKSYVKKKLQ
jgi:hypothetical protein